ncbi:MAG: four-helix bundle copper-binding protein [Hymenobacteraceae bacterium]|nr:four-helix bundle copper-binding protein [Hymenobacteraceae bacterium]MDX5394663.1 four-helix bundle copper-binding protein [Hymenobacteraceae bacterium]MDX5442580.1 four-helix bundle copper-binding protein [Hymenobacteraceae bacterium]MDX5510694.1 four-helix bundle copper-binding protein [Hymenobacteraceae bacterium]
MHKEFQNVIQALHDCAAACDHCASACLKEDNVKMMARCIMLDMDCAAMCHVTAAALARGSEMRRTFLQACMELCRACGEECAKHEHDHCKECAEACRKCEQACQQAM